MEMDCRSVARITNVLTFSYQYANAASLTVSVIQKSPKHSNHL